MGNERQDYEENLDRVLNIQQQLDAANARIKELEQWKEQARSMMNPILDYCQDPKNAKKLGISLGQSVFKRILEILKDIK